MTTITDHRHSTCESCGRPIVISIVVGEQRWNDVTRRHDDLSMTPLDDHRAVPELRIACDATCPACDYPEIGFAPARAEFICSRCGHTQTDRPKD